MVSLTTSFALLALAFSGLASSQFSPHVKHESRRSLPVDWEQTDRAPADFVLPLRIGLTQPNLDRIESLLHDVSHPESPNYGNHWSAAKVASTFRPSADSVAAVRDWLVDEGIEPSRIRLSKNFGWLEANVTIAEAEHLLKTEYHVYNHATTDTKHIACGSGYHLPEHVSKHVDLVTPTLHFDAIVKRGAGHAKRFGNNAIRPGDPGFGPVSPKTVGSIKVCGSAAVHDLELMGVEFGLEHYRSTGGLRRPHHSSLYPCTLRLRLYSTRGQEEQYWDRYVLYLRLNYANFLICLGSRVHSAGLCTIRLGPVLQELFHIASGRETGPCGH